MVDFRVTIPGNCQTWQKGNCKLLVKIFGGWQFPGIFTGKFGILQVTIFKSVTKSGYYFLEVVFLQKTFLFLNSYKTVQTEKIYKNPLWTICTNKGLWFRGKRRWGHLRTIFATSGICYPEVVNIFVNISGKTKIFSKIF